MTGLNYSHYAKVAETRDQIRKFMGDKYLMDWVDEIGKRFKWVKWKN